MSKRQKRAGQVFLYGEKAKQQQIKDKPKRHKQIYTGKRKHQDAKRNPGCCSRSGDWSQRKY